MSHFIENFYRQFVNDLMMSDDTFAESFSWCIECRIQNTKKNEAYYDAKIIEQRLNLA